MNTTHMVTENILQREIELIDLNMTHEVQGSPVKPNYGVAFFVSHNERLAIVKHYLTERLNTIHNGEPIER